MNKIKILIVVLLLLLFTIITGCIEKEETVVVEWTEVITKEQYTIVQIEDLEIPGYSRRLIVLHDDERNVTCWILSSDNGGGISCIPDWQLTPPAIVAVNMSNDCNCS